VNLRGLSFLVRGKNGSNNAEYKFYIWGADYEKTMEYSVNDSNSIYYRFLITRMRC
jgi:hypothetical protein